MFNIQYYPKGRLRAANGTFPCLGEDEFLVVQGAGHWPPEAGPRLLPQRVREGGHGAGRLWRRTLRENRLSE